MNTEKDTIQENTGVSILRKMESLQKFVSLSETKISNKTKYNMGSVNDMTSDFVRQPVSF